MKTNARVLFSKHRPRVRFYDAIPADDEGHPVDLVVQRWLPHVTEHQSILTMQDKLIAVLTPDQQRDFLHLEELRNTLAAEREEAFFDAGVGHGIEREHRRCFCRFGRSPRPSSLSPRRSPNASCSPRSSSREAEERAEGVVRSLGRRERRRDVAGERVVEESTMIADTKKRASETTKVPMKKSMAVASTPLASNAPTRTAVVRRPIVQTSTETKTPKAGDAKANTYEARMRALAPVVRLRKKLEANAKRLSKVSEEALSWANAPSELREAATSATTALAALIAVAMALPDDFKPEGIRNGSARHLAPGSKVTIRENVSTKYDGILEPEERSTLEVVSVSSGKHARVVSVRTASGLRLVLPRAHVTRGVDASGLTSASSSPSAESRAVT